ncbi:amino acid permease [Megasphaera cerevisiae DSM 20462]|jgi:amino acid transporter|uniref:Amino acid permease n=1 Tax=Megasphaera cerevisiae DSM 20462 TaxID=1122219 RepID=A0A0J6WWG1_9FIRM|nr:APC family permease [Megasphaera cerevisiae]KMO86934.1 amino acid permease [Megasphaera cerevisiae DSM 20462]OKY54113.1 amino acid permease [Megasphaera cerevisiae]SJZ55550.1 amino acid/polyamine/organocation transporter, APC superfamily (TC 2.A.3) [Megasphaera cerevisiae DSM 20462]
MNKQSGKFGFWSIVLLGINGIVGTGIFLLPNKAYSLIGTASLGVLLFDALLAGCMALCFAEVAGFFTRNGGPYLYAKHSLGDFFGYEVGVLKWIVVMIAWATMAVGFATALGAAFPVLAGETMKDIIATAMIIILTILNIAGVNATKILSNIITISKLVPLIAFIVIGIFFVNGADFSPIFPGNEYQEGTFASAAILLFFAYTGFEAIAVAAEDMENPKKNLPRAIIVTMIIVSVLYMLILGISIGIMGTDLAHTKAPIQDAFGMILGPAGAYFVLAGTLLSMGGINMAESFLGPRVCTSLAEDGMLPAALAKRTAWNTPYVASIVTAVFSILLAWSGSFTTLAAISAVSRFTQYLPTCIAVIIFRKKWSDKERPYTIPFGLTIPIIAIVVSLWMLAQAQISQLIWGFGGCIVVLPFYFIYLNKKRKGLIKENDVL